MSAVDAGSVRHRLKVGQFAKHAPTTNRRSIALAATGFLCVLLGSLGFVVLQQSLDKRMVVLAIDKPVALGSPIDASNLREVRVSADPSLRLVPASRVSELIGVVATTPLTSGSLLTEGQWRAQPAIPTGSAIVGVSLKGAQVPAELHGGDHVSVIDISLATPSVLVADAVVFTTPVRPDASGTTVASLLVSAEVSPQVTVAAAAGKISLVMLGQNR